MDFKALDREYIAGTYDRFPVEIVSGKGSVMTDETGKTYIDLGSGIGVTSFGAADELWQQAVIAQIGRVQHTSNLYYTQPDVLLAKLLCEKTGMKKVFFSNSGAEDVLLMVDEVQTGNGRTGALYSYMNYGVQPDVVSTAKGLAGGLPLGATLMGAKCADVLGFGDHGSTFGGNPVCCAAALSILQRIDDGLLAAVREKGDYLRQRFTGAPGILSVRGMGLMLGLETAKPAGAVVKECLQRGVLCLTAKDRVRLLPALNIPAELLEKAADVICAVCAE